MNQFLQIQDNHVPRSENDKEVALAKLAASLTLWGTSFVGLSLRPFWWNRRNKCGLHFWGRRRSRL